MHGWHAHLRALEHRCRCTDGDCDHAPEGEILGELWARCPYEALRNPYFVACVYLADVQSHQPLADWPCGWSRGAVQAITHIRNEMAELAVRQARERKQE